jgi:histidinol-phosphate aminotransferase
MAAEITAATRLVIVCNPNNPTSTALPLEDIKAFIADVPPHVAVILDEAYTEFNILQDPDESIPLLKKHPNLVLLRTFSKVYGLCGIRVGYALAGADDFRQAVDRVRQPFSVNMLAQAAATEALDHQDEVATRVERTAVERLHVEQALDQRGLEQTDSQANFSWVGVGERPEAEVMRALGERGVIVRAGSALGQEGWIRVTYGTRAENDRFLEALDQAMLEVPEAGTKAVLCTASVRSRQPQPHPAARPPLPIGPSGDLSRRPADRCRNAKRNAEIALPPGAASTGLNLGPPAY